MQGWLAAVASITMLIGCARPRPGNVPMAVYGDVDLSPRARVERADRSDSPPFATRTGRIAIIAGSPGTESPTEQGIVLATLVAHLEAADEHAPTRCGGRRQCFELVALDAPDVEHVLTFTITFTRNLWVIDTAVRAAGSTDPGAPAIWSGHFESADPGIAAAALADTLLPPVQRESIPAELPPPPDRRRMIVGTRIGRATVRD